MAVFRHKFEGRTVRNIKGCVKKSAVQTDFFENFGQFFKAARRSE
jgi:hypothetical protein